MNIQNTSVPILGMTCAGCAASVEDTLREQQGVQEIVVNYASQTAQITFDNTQTTLLQLQKVLQDVGYNLVLANSMEAGKEQQKDQQAKSYEALKKDVTWAGILTIPLVCISMFFMNMPYANEIMGVLATPIVLFFGRRFFISAYKKILHLQTNMDTLVAMSTSIAYIFSVFNTLFPHYWHTKGLHNHVYFEASAVIITFILIGKLLEEKAKSQTSTAIEKLIGLQAKTVRIIQNDTEKEIPIENIKHNDIIMVRSGEKVAVDGEIVRGEGIIDESMLSGEAMPVEKKVGDKVFAGTINQDSSFLFRAEKIGKETLLSQIIQRVENAQNSKAPIQKLVDKIASVFVPFVLLIALITFCTWVYIAPSHHLHLALLNTITVLVIACPCALGLATPTAIMVAMGVGANKGILIKDAESLEVAHSLNAIVLDKTGTITEGKPQINNFIWLSPNNHTDIANIIYQMETQTEHPLAKAIMQYIENQHYNDLIKDIVLENFQNNVGLGISANYEQDSYFIGKIAFENLKNALPSAEILHKFAYETWVQVRKNNQVVCLISLSDKIKENSASAIQKLQNMGLSIYMLTGDNEYIAKHIAQELQITNYKANILPSDKALFIKNLQKAGKKVAMVGDGINDSEALAVADVSIAMGKGADIAMEVAKITFINSELTALSNTILLSRNAMKIVKENLFWAFVYNIIAIPIAAGILYPFLINPMLAGGAMAFSSVSVVLNSLRLKNIQFS
jgi:Cu2+-exporting ATPase